jgi:large subunit ribosomal protein L9
MNVILLEKNRNLGKIGDVVSVRPGYARNFLLPQKKALRATAENIALFEEKKAHVLEENAKKREEAQKVAKTMEDVLVALVRQAGDSGFLYGSVRPQDISELLTKAGHLVSRTQVHLAEPIKTIGIHEVEVYLHPEVCVKIRVNVAQSLEQAAAKESMAEQSEDE